MNVVNVHTTGFKIFQTWLSNSQSLPALNTFSREDIENFLCSTQSPGMPTPKSDQAVSINLLGSTATLFPQKNRRNTSLIGFFHPGSPLLTASWSALTMALAFSVMEAPKM